MIDAAASGSDIRIGGVPPRSGQAPVLGLPTFARRPVLTAAALMLVLELAVSARYGLHRDELYFLECAHHLSWGYVDQPPLVPAVARLVVILFGPSALWLRLLPATAGAATVVMTALTARQLGGGRRAQIVGAVAAAASAQAEAGFHLLSTTAFDMFCWSAVTYVLVRMLRTGNPRWWLAVGAAVGVGLLNKLNVGYLVAGTLIGLTICRRWPLMRPTWLAAGGGVAAIIASPDVAWNVTHHWAQLSMLESLHRENSTLGASLGFLPAQVIVVGPVLAWVWLPGLKRLLRHPTARPLAVTYLVLLVLYALAGAKSYYLAGMYYVLFAGGGLYIEDRLSGLDTGRLRTRITAMAAGAAVALPLTLPVLPQSALAAGPWQASINKDLSATVGWPAFTRQINQISSALPRSERARLVIYTGDYGAAGAIDLYGPTYGLPQAISGHNNFWWWGTADASDHSTTIAVNLPRSYLLTMFTHVQLAGVVATPGGVWTEERGDPIWICTGQTESWVRAWPTARHYD